MSGRPSYSLPLRINEVNARHLKSFLNPLVFPSKSEIVRLTLFILLFFVKPPLRHPSFPSFLPSFLSAKIETIPRFRTRYFLRLIPSRKVSGLERCVASRTGVCSLRALVQLSRKGGKISWKNNDYVVAFLLLLLGCQGSCCWIQFFIFVDIVFLFFFSLVSRCF